jgi:hypothetical protein
MKRHHLLLAGGLSMSAWFAFFADKTPDTGIAQAVVRTVTPGAAKPSGAGAAPATGATEKSGISATEPAIDTLHPRTRLIADTDDPAFIDRLFMSQNWTPPPPPNVVAPVLAPPPPPPPMAPPMPFTYLGKALDDGGWEVFLARAEQIYIVRGQTVMDGVYRVETIAPPTLSLTYLPLNQVQQINIGASD